MERSDSAPQVVVITGVNGGLGQALATLFSQNGMRVAGIGRQPAARTRPSGDFEYWQADIGDAKQVAATFAAIHARFGRIDVLFNNAAVYPKVSFLEQSPEDWAATIGINVNGMAFCCRAALEVMLRQGKGRIYNVGSFADLGPIPKSAAYSASKGAVHALVKGIAADLQGSGADVQVHEWIPGHMNTQMSDFTGIDPIVSARWALEIVRADNASKNGTIFDQDREWMPPERFVTRVLRKLGLKR